MDAVAKAGVVGLSNNTPESLPAGSDTANLSLLGYNPLEHFTGGASLEAAAQGMSGNERLAIRCNLVTVEGQEMKSFTAGHISSPEAAELIKTAQENLGSTELQFYPGVGSPKLLVYRGHGPGGTLSPDTRTTPPHDLTDKWILSGSPRGPGSDLLNHLMSESVRLFADHPVNVARRAAGKPPATHVWLWGLGGAPRLTPSSNLWAARGDDYRRGLGPRPGRAHRLAADRGARRHRLPRHRLRGQGPLCRGRARGRRPGLCSR